MYIKIDKEHFYRTILYGNIFYCHRNVSNPWNTKKVRRYKKAIKGSKDLQLRGNLPLEKHTPLFKCRALPESLSDRKSTMIR